MDNIYNMNNMHNIHKEYTTTQVNKYQYKNISIKHVSRYYLNIKKSKQVHKNHHLQYALMYKCNGSFKQP